MGEWLLQTEVFTSWWRVQVPVAEEANPAASFVFLWRLEDGQDLYLVMGTNFEERKEEGSADKPLCWLIGDF